MKYEFPEKIYIAHAFCENCNNNEFIVDGQSQFCNQCGGILYRENKKLYTTKRNKEKKKVQKYKRGKIVFPEEIMVGYAYCSQELEGEEVVIKDRVICQECEEIMKIKKVKKYFLI